MAKVPAVSVILPTHDRAHLLQRCIKSVLAQTFPDFELLVVDDASSDDTSEVVGAFRDDRLRLVRLETNVGGGAARNAGVSLARAPIIAFQDSDDLWLPHKLQRCIETLGRDPELLGVFSSFIQVDGRSVVFGPATVPHGAEMAESILRENFIDTPTSLVRKEAFTRCGGFDPALPRYQDWELFMRLLRMGPFAYIEEPLVLSFVTPGSISSNDRAHSLAMRRIYEKHGGEIASRTQLNASWLANMGDAELRLGSVAEGRLLLWRSWCLRPLHPGMLLRNLAAWMGGGRVYQRLSRMLERGRGRRR